MLVQKLCREHFTARSAHWRQVLALHRRGGLPVMRAPIDLSHDAVRFGFCRSFYDRNLSPVRFVGRYPVMRDAVRRYQHRSQWIVRDEKQVHRVLWGSNGARRGGLEVVKSTPPLKSRNPSASFLPFKRELIDISLSVRYVQL